MRWMRRVFVMAGVSALAVSWVPSAGAQSSEVVSVIGSAQGVSADLTATAVGGPSIPIAVGPVPSVTLPPEGGSATDQIAGISESVFDELIMFNVALVRTTTEGQVGPAGFATAETVVEELSAGVFDTVTDLNVAAELVSASCAASGSGVTGSTALVGASVLGVALDAAPAPNTVVPIDVAGNTATVTLNRQVTNPDGSLTVTALVVEIEVSLDVGGTLFTLTGAIEVGPATCGVVEGEIPTEPVPAPVQAQVRFTG